MNTAPRLPDFCAANFPLTFGLLADAPDLHHDARELAAEGLNDRQIHAALADALTCN